MSQLRGVLRGIAYDNREGPARVLARLDTAIEGLLTTVLVGRLSRTGDGAHRLRWASAGHLPPLVVGPDGTSRRLTTDRAGLLLGVDPATLRVKVEVVLERGSTLLLYTDGLVERRDQLFDDDPGAEDDVALVGVRLL